MNDNTKITLTIGQLRRLVKESRSAPSEMWNQYTEFTPEFIDELVTRGDITLREKDLTGERWGWGCDICLTPANVGKEILVSVFSVIEAKNNGEHGWGYEVVGIDKVKGPRVNLHSDDFKDDTSDSLPFTERTRKSIIKALANSEGFKKLCQDDIDQSKEKALAHIAKYRPGDKRETRQRMLKYDLLLQGWMESLQRDPVPQDRQELPDGNTDKDRRMKRKQDDMHSRQNKRHIDKTIQSWYERPGFYSGD